jgi:solute carrier family 25 (mitochondrial carnitine/acylcarnitine transporter), member 20/29
MGFYRGLWIPLMTISFVRTSTVTFRFSRLLPNTAPGAASFTIYNRTKEHFRNHNYLCRNSLLDVALTGGISGAMSGALISFSSTREFPAALQIPV